MPATGEYVPTAHPMQMSELFAPAFDSDKDI